MKKVLLGASAIIGAASLAAPAVAAEAPSISFSGAMAYEIIAHDGDVQAAGTGLNITANEQQSELGWKGRGTADNGLEYGANIEWRWASGSTPGSFDEAWMDFKGTFGRVYIGGEDGVTDLVASSNGQTNQVGAWGTDGNNALRHVNFLGLSAGTHYYINHAGNTGDNNKIGYITPSFGGFKAGLNFTPEGNFAQATGVNNGANQNAWEFAAAYSGQFDAVSFKVDAAYGIGEDNTANASGADNEDVGAYQLGAEVGAAGFMVGASYGDNDDSGCIETSNQCDAGSFWDIGASYAFGAAKVSASYQEAEDDTDGNGFNDESEIFHAGFYYKVADGLGVHANYYNFSLTNESGAAVGTQTSNDADVLILGSRITF